MNGDDRTHGLWEASAPDAPATVRLETDIEADVVVIGAGYTGCSAALHLAIGGKNVAVLEASEIGFGGAGRNVGLVNAGLWIMPDKLPQLLGQPYGDRVLRQLGQAPQLVFDIVERYGISCEAKREGTLHCAVGSDGLAEITERAEQWKRLGAPVELLDADHARNLIGSSAYTGALLDRRAGTIQPLGYARGLAAAAISEGALIYTRSPAASLEDLGNAWLVRSNTGSVIARCVIVATDAYAKGPWEELRQEQVMLPYFNLATQPLSENLRKSILPQRQGAWDTRDVLSSFRFDDAGRLVFGSVGALRGSGTTIHRGWAKREMARLFPQLGDIDFEHEWYGWIGMTSDACPRFHELDRNIYSISGFNGRGIGPGTSFGRDLARLALGELTIEDMPLPLTKLRRAALRNSKGAVYEFGSQAVHLVGARISNLPI